MRAEDELILLTSAINKSKSEVKRIEDCPNLLIGDT